MEESITRVCTKCKEDKPLSQYRFMRYGKQQKGTVCKDCCREIKKEWKNKNRDKVNSAQIRNIQPLCKSCNSKKHTDTTDYRIKNG